MKKTYQTPAEKFRQSSTYATLKHRLHDYLKKCRLQRRRAAVWLFLRRNGRLHKHYKTENEQNTNKDEQDSVNTEDDEQDTSHSDTYNDQARLNQVSNPVNIFSHDQVDLCNDLVVSDNNNDVPSQKKNALRL